MAFTDKTADFIFDRIFSFQDSDELAENDEHLRATLAVEHKWNASSVDGTHSDITADSVTMAGNIVMAGNSITSTTSLLFTTGSSAGNNFTINTSMFVVEGNSGKVGFGNTSPGNLVEISKSAAVTDLEISTWSTTDTHLSRVILQKSASATINTLIATAGGEDLGAIVAQGVNTSSAADASSQILFEGDAAPDADAVPGRIVFQTADLVGLKTALYIDDSQNIGFGNTSPGSRGEFSKSAANTDLEISTWSTTDTHLSQLIFQKSSSATINTLAVTASGEDLGAIIAQGVNTGSAADIACKILFEADAAPDANGVPGRMTFQTADSLGALQTALFIDDEQKVGIGTSTNIGAALTLSANSVIAINTLDGSDSGTISLAAGGDDLDSRGAFIQLWGNEAGLPGSIRIVAGDEAGALIEFYTVGTKRGYVGGSGGLIWGTATGGDKGAGAINAQAVYDDNTLLGPDYVFDKYFDGKVKTGEKNFIYLDEKKTWDFLEKNRHLPTIVGRKEWEKNGNTSLGKLVKMLWETVEVQQIHIHEQNDRITKLELFNSII